jgi:hypothetical protein
LPGGSRGLGDVYKRQNLRGESVPWYGKTGYKNGFSVFSKMDYGVTALHTDLSAKLSKGVNTIYKIIHMFAPKSDGNNPDGVYIPFVVKKTGLSKDAILNKNDIPVIMHAIMLMETGTNLGINKIVSIVNAVNIEKSQKKK